MDTKGACPSAREVGWQRVSKCLKSIQLVYSRMSPAFSFSPDIFFLYSSAVTYIYYLGKKKWKRQNPLNQ